VGQPSKLEKKGIGWHPRCPFPTHLAFVEVDWSLAFLGIKVAQVAITDWAYHHAGMAIDAASEGMDQSCPTNLDISEQLLPAIFTSVLDVLDQFGFQVDWQNRSLQAF
jgi:hypothetical protein